MGKSDLGPREAPDVLSDRPAGKRRKTISDLTGLVRTQSPGWKNGLLSGFSNRANHLSFNNASPGHAH